MPGKTPLNYPIESLGIKGLTDNKTFKFGYSHDSTNDNIVSVSHFDYNGMKTYALHFSNPNMNVLGTIELEGIRDGLVKILNDLRNCSSIIISTDAGSTQAGGNLRETRKLLEKEDYLNEVTNRLYLAASINEMLNNVPRGTEVVASQGGKELYGGGFELSLMPKLPMVAMEGMKASFPEVSIGIKPGYGGTVNSFLKSRQNAGILTISADEFWAKELYEAGIVGKIVDNPGWENSFELQKALMEGTLQYLTNIHNNGLGQIGTKLLRGDMGAFRHEIDYRTTPGNYDKNQSVGDRKAQYNDFRGKVPLSPESVRMQEFLLDVLSTHCLAGTLNKSTINSLIRFEAMLDVLFYRDREFLKYSIDSKFNKVGTAPDQKTVQMIVDFSSQKKVGAIYDLDSIKVL